MKQLQLSRALVTRLLNLAQNSADKEICGLIGGRDGEPGACYPVANSSNQPDIKFQMDPQEQIAAMRKMAEAGEELFAIYHSHPSSVAVPSKTDLELNQYPDAVHLIIALGTRGVLELRAYKLDRKGTTEIPVSI